jgi:heme/copper-type cytochrome/quinol oxidase subunit 2
VIVSSAILWACALVVAAVFAVMIHSIATFRRAAEPQAARAHGALAEIFWAIVPIFIMISSALPAVRMLTADDDHHALQAQNEAPFTASAASYNADRK